MNIFITFCEIHGSKKLALEHLNKSLGTSYIHSKYVRWERGEILPNHKALHLIYTAVLNYVLGRVELDSETTKELASQLALPSPKIKAAAIK